MANYGTKKMKKGGKVTTPKKITKAAKSSGIKVRGTGCATKGLMARGPMG